MSKATHVQRLRFDLTSLRLLLATAELGSITRAADTMAIATTAASRRIADIEEQFGLQLFERRPHGMLPTEAGLALLAHARNMLRIVDHMHDDALSFSQGGRGQVRLAVCTSAALQFMPQDLRRHRSRFPHIDIEINEATSRDVIKALAHDHAELGIAERTAIDLPDGLVCRHYHSDRLVLVTYRDHPLASAASVKLADILGHELISLGEGTAVDGLLTRLAAGSGMRLRCNVRARSFDFMLAMVRAELGMGIAPHSIAQWLASDAAFRCVSIDEPWASRDFVLCHKPSPYISSTTLTVANFLAGETLPD